MNVSALTRFCFGSFIFIAQALTCSSPSASNTFNNRLDTTTKRLDLILNFITQCINMKHANPISQMAEK